MPFSVYSEKGGKRECQRKCQGGPAAPLLLLMPGAVSPPGHVGRANTHILKESAHFNHIHCSSAHFIEGSVNVHNQHKSARFPGGIAAVGTFSNYVSGLLCFTS